MILVLPPFGECGCKPVCKVIDRRIKHHFQGVTYTSYPPMSVMATTSSFTFSDSAFTSFFEPGVEFKYSATEDRELVEVKRSRWCFFLNSHYYHFQVPFDYLHFSRCNLLTPPFCPTSTATTTKTTETPGALKSGSKHNGNVTQLSYLNSQDQGDPGGPKE